MRWIFVQKNGTHFVSRTALPVGSLSHMRPLAARLRLLTPCAPAGEGQACTAQSLPLEGKVPAKRADEVAAPKGSTASEKRPAPVGAATAASPPSPLRDAHIRPPAAHPRKTNDAPPVKSASTEASGDASLRASVNRRPRRGGYLSAAKQYPRPKGRGFENMCHIFARMASTCVRSGMTRSAPFFVVTR